MARQRSHSIAFKRQVAQEFIAGETLYGLSKRHDISRQLIRVWVQKYEVGALDEDVCSRNTKPRLRRWSGWLADRRSKTISPSPSKCSLSAMPGRRRNRACRAWRSNHPLA
jgi:transposase-like protein